MSASGKSYNYARFKMSNYELGYFPGPKAGERTDLDYSFVDLAGKEISLADYAGKWVVLETGSLTCPMFVKNVRPYAKLRAKYPDVEWLVVYVREAHPGSRLEPARTIDEKIAYARRAKDEYDEGRDILVDTVDGKWHHAWGLLPNMIYVIDPDGRVVYRADWSFADNVERVLRNRGPIDAPEHLMIFGAAPWITIPVTLKGGWDALYDIAITIPKIFYAHLKVDFTTWLSKRKLKRTSLL